MFSHEGTARSERQNRILAGYLAFVGGYANSCGIVLVGTFTSHVTGNVGRFASQVALGEHAAALAALSCVAAFFAGAFVGSMFLESRALGHVSRAYALTLALEAVTLTVFWLGLDPPAWASAARLQLEAATLSAAMGLQNGLVTRLSGAVVRTTHLTGVVTDLGVELARWFRYGRAKVAERLGARLVLGKNEPERPAPAKVFLLGTIAAAFVLGATAGAAAAVRAGRDAILLAIVAITLCVVYAIVNGRAHAERRGSREVGASSGERE